MAKGFEIQSCEILMHRSQDHHCFTRMSFETIASHTCPLNLEETLTMWLHSIPCFRLRVQYLSSLYVLSFLIMVRRSRRPILWRVNGPAMVKQLLDIPQNKGWTDYKPLYWGQNVRWRFGGKLWSFGHHFIVICFTFFGGQILKACST